MSEITISVQSYDQLEIFGVNDSKMELIQKIFPKLKIIARGDEIKAIGDPEQVELFGKKFHFLLLHFEKTGHISESDIIDILRAENGFVQPAGNQPDDVLVYGKNGMQIKARTINQQRMVDSCNKNDLVFAIGPAGTGKTYTAVALAVKCLKEKMVKRIILTRPAVEAGENLGFLPGDLKDKLDPYLQPLYDALRDMLPPQKLLTYLEDGTIEIAPLAFMRGRTLDHAFAILDEAQNATEGQLKMFLTRMGRSAKFMVTGDITQIDLPKNQASGLIQAARILGHIHGIEFIYLDDRDVIRHKLVTRIIAAYGKDSDKSQEKKIKQSETIKEDPSGL